MNLLASHLENYCYRHSINFNGYIVDTLTGIKSVSHCQFECQKSEACDCFSYNIVSGDCVRKKVQAMSDPLANGDIISGSKFCMKNASKF